MKKKSHAHGHKLNLRASAAQALSRVYRETESLNTVLPELGASFENNDKSLLQEIVFGSCRWFFSLETLVKSHLKKPLHKHDQIVYMVLIQASYQLIFTRVPHHAAINESVEACKQLGHENLSGLVNALLRRIKEQDLKPEAFEAKLSHPGWMQEKISHNWPQHADQIFRQNNQHPPMSLRVNRLKTSREDYLRQLSEAGIEAVPSDVAKYGIRLLHPCHVQRLPNFDEGFVSVQDEAAQLCSEILSLQPGNRVLDACAAPGGKTCALLESEPEITLSALERDKKRAPRIQENLQRLKLHAEIIIADGCEAQSWWDGKAFDHVLLDAPCSATGVIRRHPDIKLLRREQDIVNLAQNQLNLLLAIWPTLKQGGTLLYATCSIFPQENNRIVERFIKQTPDAEIETLDLAFGIDTGFGHQMLPTENSHDGFFYAKLVKTVV